MRINVFLKRLGLGLLKDFLKVGGLFLIIFVLMMLHLTGTVRIAPIEWLLKANTEKATTFTKPEPRPQPNLLPIKQ